MSHFYSDLNYIASFTADVIVWNVPCIAKRWPLSLGK